MIIIGTKVAVVTFNIEAFQLMDHIINESGHKNLMDYIYKNTRVVEEKEYVHTIAPERFVVSEIHFIPERRSDVAEN